MNATAALITFVQMQKVKKLLKALGIIMRRPYMLNVVLEHDLIWQEQLEKKYPEFVKGLPVVDLAAITGHTEFELNGNTFLDGGSSVGDYILLKYLAKRIANCDYFEIGTFRGESLLNVATEVDSATSINLSDEELRSLNLGESLIEQIGILAKEIPNVTLLKGNSFTYDFEKLGKKYDMVFIDGDHHYEAVKNDTEKVFSHLIKETGVVVWHDYTYYPDKLRPEVFLGILDGIPEAYRHKLVHVRNTNCAVMIDKDFAKDKLEYPAYPKNIFKVKVKILEA